MKQRLRLSREAWRRLVKKIDADQASFDLRTRMVYSAAGAKNSLLAKLQNLSRAEALEKTEIPAPIFLLGFWRSGTTFLHELFCCDKRFGFPSTYACMNPAHFLLTEKTFQKSVAKKPTLRPMDNMQYTWQSPQEDEFALLCMGAPSPYEALLAPSLMGDPRALCDLRGRSPQEQERWSQTLQLFLRLLTLQQHKPMVLKSPPHGFRLPLLPGLFPQARFVIIERNPYEVFASNLKLWRTLLEMYSLESFSASETESFVLAAYVIHDEAIAEGMRGLAPGKLAHVRYEDLIRDPLGQMKRIYAQAELGGFEDARGALEEHVSNVAGHQRNRFVLTPQQKATVEERWGTLISEKGYSWPEEWVRVKDS
ncbi:MAG TPA: sulfotransferase [Candidatus Sulfotelmatobacter sp.]|nr:sulfotransferase [Candidatus Sulfotelmatobacter sp.]